MSDAKNPRKPRKSSPGKKAAVCRPPATPGRPSYFRTEYVEIVRRLALLGLTDAEIAGVLGTSEPTLNKWKREHPQFAEELKRGKQVPDSNVAASLYQRAIGYNHESVKIFNAGGAPLVVPFTEHFAPDVTACIFWLKNRQPKLWRDRLEHDHKCDVAGLPNDVLEVMRRLAAQKARGKG